MSIINPDLLLSTNQKISRREVTRLIALASMTIPFAMSCKEIKPALQAGELQSIHFATLSEIADFIRNKKISSEEITRLILKRIETLDTKLNSYITVMNESALSTAKAMDKELAEGKYRGPLHGVPIAVKDLLFTTNAPTTGSHSFNANFIPSFNATVIDKLQQAGAIILGKLNLTEGAMGGYNSISKIPKNPWGSDLWTGVSSSGSGVATAAGLCFGSIGSDTGGSIRFPCVANGIVGMKPTYGLVSRYGVLPLAESLDHVGPMTRTVLDAALMLEVMAGYDPHDATSLEDKAQPMYASIKDNIKGMKIGVDHNYISKDVDPGLSTSIESAIKKLEELGATIVPFEMPSNEKERGGAWFTIVSKEAFESNKSTYPSRKNEYGNDFAGILEMGSKVTETQYKQARQLQVDFKTKFRSLLSTVDAFAAPAGGMAKGLTDEMWRSKEGVIPHFSNELDLQFGEPADMAGIPALTLPCGKAEGGMPPPGFQLMGGPLTEASLFRIGYAYEQATEWYKQHPNI
ncbi:MAG: amidase [Saprospiraceae bacterium]